MEKSFYYMLDMYSLVYIVLSLKRQLYQVCTNKKGINEHTLGADKTSWYNFIMVLVTYLRTTVRTPESQHIVNEIG